MRSLQPLLDRDRYSEEEWALSAAGKCDWLVANYPALTWCEEPSDPNSFYRWCTDHDRQARDDNPDAYGR